MSLTAIRPLPLAVAIEDDVRVRGPAPSQTPPACRPRSIWWRRTGVMSPPRMENSAILPPAWRAICMVSGSSAFRTLWPRRRTPRPPPTSPTARSSTVSMPFRPRWSSVTFSTAPTSQTSKPRPSRRMPPRAVSSTAASTLGLRSTIRALLGPLASAAPDQVVVQIDARRGGHADVQAGCARRICATMRDGGRFAVGAGDREDRDAASRRAAGRGLR